MDWIDDYDFPGGLVAFNVVMCSSIVETLGYTAYITANFLANGLLVSICVILCSKHI